MTRFKTLSVVCDCSFPLALYLKGGRGRLRKMYFGRIKEDLCGLFNNEPPLPLGLDLHCPACKKRVGTVARVFGNAAVKINQGVIRA